jgi:hypothetical protein
MRKAAGLFSIVILCGLAAPVGAEPVPKLYQPIVEQIGASIAATKARRGETVVLRVHLHLKDRAFTFPTQTDKEMAEVFQKATFAILNPDVVIPVGVLREPKSRTREVPELDWKFLIVEGRTTWEQPLVISPAATPGEHHIKLRTFFPIMDDRSCRPPLRIELKAPLEITDEAVSPVEERYAEEVQRALKRNKK